MDDPPLLDLNRLDNRATSAIASTDSLNAVLAYTEQQASTLACPNALISDDEDALVAVTLTFAKVDGNDTLELTAGLNNAPAITRTGATTTLTCVYFPPLLIVDSYCAMRSHLLPLPLGSLLLLALRLQRRFFDVFATAIVATSLGWMLVS